MPALRMVLFGAGVALVVAALVSPLSALAERQLQFCHMIQHLLLGDLGPLCAVLGLTEPVLRPLLPLLWRLRVFLHPVVALPAWAANLALWHVPGVYDAALRDHGLHALQHLLLFVCAALVWALVLRPVPRPAWFGSGARLIYVTAAGIIGAVLANVFIWSSGAFYSLYEAAPRRFGISADGDQRIAGGVMMLEGSVVTLAVLAWLLHQVLADWEQTQRLPARRTGTERSP